jgi:hypothetical protein
MFLGLLIVDPITATLMFLVFSFVGYLLYRFMHLRAGFLGIENSNLNIRSSEKIVEVFASYRESVVRNRRDFYAREIGNLRYLLANTSAEMNFLPYVSKYVIESGMVGGAVCIAGAQFAMQDARHAVAALSVFLAAGTGCTTAGIINGLSKKVSDLWQLRIGSLTLFAFASDYNLGYVILC